MNRVSTFPSQTRLKFSIFLYYGRVKVGGLLCSIELSICCKAAVGTGNFVQVVGYDLHIEYY